MYCGMIAEDENMESFWLVIVSLVYGKAEQYQNLQIL
jgi:hypothetical protein